nr:MAG TPA: hypothetical protein [Bacteriophage sp.]
MGLHSLLPQLLWHALFVLNSLVQSLTDFLFQNLQRQYPIKASGKPKHYSEVFQIVSSQVVLQDFSSTLLHQEPINQEN